MTGPAYRDEQVTVWLGDCLDILPTLSDESIDSIVTDPPYGLEFMGKEWDAPWKAAGSVVSDPAAVGGFQDGAGGNPYSRSRIRFGVGAGFQDWCETWAVECLRVLKPGGHLAAFGGTRTFHRLACAIEDAGFEIRDSIGYAQGDPAPGLYAWMYGSGFPKSLDVGKAIDKARHDRADVLRATAWIAAHTTAPQLDAAAGTNGMGGHWTSQGSQAAVPTSEAWARIAHLLPDPPEWFRALIKPARLPGEAWERREVTQEAARPLVSGNTISFDQRGSNERERRDIPATGAAREWQGYGTALKPAFEPIVVARKPIRGTVAANVLEYGTGALNIDRCRVGTDEDTSRQPACVRDTAAPFGRGVAMGGRGHAAGRWPANVVLDEAAAKQLDTQSGTLTSGAMRAGVERTNRTGYTGPMPATTGQATNGDSGGASRFFYTAKAPQHERPSVDGVAHPTVKPVDLIRWLIRLTTPPGGTVLDLFAGSGTTGEAAILEHKRAVLIEREAEYLPLIEARLRKPMQVGFDFEGET